MPNSVFLGGSSGTLFVGQAAGDLFYAIDGTTVGGVADVATGQVLVSGGLATAPAYSATPTVTTLTSSRTSLATTSTDGLIATNATVATGGATVQISPRLRLRGNAWDTAASETVDFFLENLPASAATPTGTLKFGYSLNGAAASYPMTLTSAGRLTLLGNVAAFGGDGLTGFMLDKDGTVTWSSTADPFGAADAGLKRSSASVVKVTNGGAGFGALATGTLTSTGKYTNYNSIATAGWGQPAIYGYGDVAGATGVSASIATYTVGAADGTFEVSANCLVTTATTHSFSLDVTYTDEGNTARTMILPIYSLAGTPVASALITNTGGTVPYEAPAVTIRAKAATAITVRTSAGGTYTTVTYNARGTIKQLG